MNKNLALCLLFLLPSLKGWCQGSVRSVLNRIEEMQVQNHPFYDPGLFPVQRSWSMSKRPVEDNTIFFTASIVQTLKELYPMMDLESQIKTDSIIERAIRNVAKYRSRNSEPTYNFWQTVGPDLPFPNGNSLISNTKMRLPDDLDTSIILAMSGDEKEMKGELRDKMVRYAGRGNRSESELNTLEKYKSSKAYEVWFADKMPQTFDICVMSNAMYFVLSEGFSLNEYDLATINLIKEMITNDDHLLHVDDISHHTTSMPLILYHVSRLIDADKNRLFNDLKPRVINDLLSALENPNTEFEKMLVLTSLIRLNGYPVGSIDHQKLANELTGFIFFSVKPFLGNPQLSFLNGVIPDISWTCEAYNWTLYLEYLYMNKTFLTNRSVSR